MTSKSFPWSPIANDTGLLELLFPKTRAITIAAAPVGQDRLLWRRRIERLAGLPPSVDVQRQFLVATTSRWVLFRVRPQHPLAFLPA